MEYSFNINHAKKYGVNEAIIIKNFQFWITKNKASGIHNHDGRTWTYNTLEAFTELFPFWSERQIRTVIQSLIKQEVIIKGNYNKVGYDRTTWYAFSEEVTFLTDGLDISDKSKRHICQIEETELSNGSDTSVAPIPDSKPYNKPDSKPNIPPNPQRGDVPRKRLTAGEKKKVRVTENTEQMVRIGSWFKRSANTLWTVYESEALEMVNPTDKEIVEMGRYYTAELKDGYYKRKSIDTLLNNWNSELDKARNYQSISIQDDLEKARKLGLTLEQFRQ